jgi:AbrB family looped-hinge helix DNA binding protein
MASFEAKLSSKGQLTLPVELRREWALKEGDLVEFFIDDDGRVTVMRRNRPASDLFGLLADLKSDPTYATDDDAIADQIVAEDERTKSTSRGRDAA